MLARADLYCVRRSSYGERNVKVCPGEEQAGDEAGTRDQRREGAHEGDAAAGGGTPCAGGRYAVEPEAAGLLAGAAIGQG